MKLDYGKVSVISVSGCDNTVLISGAAWAYLRYRPVDLGESTGSSKLFEYNLELYLALWLKANASRSIRYTVESGCYDSIDFGSSLTSWRCLNTTEKLLDHPSRFLIWLHTCDVGEACFIALCGYLRYLGIVRTMSTYLIWGTSTLWGQCPRTLFEILRYCMYNAYVSSLPSRYLIWKSTLWLVHLWPTTDVWLLQ